MAGPATKPYEALTHLSVHRDRQQGEAVGLAGADFVERGEKVDLDESRAARLLKLGAIRPWDQRNDIRPPVTARDMTGKMFPVPMQTGNAPLPARPSGAPPEQTDPQPGEGGAPAAIDPYATGQ